MEIFGRDHTLFYNFCDASLTLQESERYVFMIKYVMVKNACFTNEYSRQRASSVIIINLYNFFNKWSQYPSLCTNIDFGGLRDRRTECCGAP